MDELLYGRGPYFTKVKRAFRSPTLRAAFHDAVGNGWAFKVSGDTHVFLTNGKTGIQLSTTALDSNRSVKNQLATMRRKGAISRERG